MKRTKAIGDLEERIIAFAKTWTDTERAIERGFFNPIVAWETKAANADARRELFAAIDELRRLQTEQLRAKP
jgi:hypothetical protein